MEYNKDGILGESIYYKGITPENIDKAIERIRKLHPGITWRSGQEFSNCFTNIKSIQYQHEEGFFTYSVRGIERQSEGMMKGYKIRNAYDPNNK